jgi:hypothetical protein
LAIASIILSPLEGIGVPFVENQNQTDTLQVEAVIGVPSKHFELDT